MRRKYKSKRCLNHRKVKLNNIIKNKVKDCLLYGILVLICIIVIIVSLNTKTKSEQNSVIATAETNVIQEESIDETQEQNIEVAEVQQEAVQADNIEHTQVTSRGDIDRQQNTNVLEGYRITCYYPGDDCSSGITTGSGKSIYNFDTMYIGNKSVYTYNGKIVTACATKELLRTGYSVRGSQNPQDKYYFKYYQEYKIVIDGVIYDAICLDSCGASMWEGEYRIDIFVPTPSDCISKYNVTAYI